MNERQERILEGIARMLMSSHLAGAEAQKLWPLLRRDSTDDDVITHEGSARPYQLRKAISLERLQEIYVAMHGEPDDSRLFRDDKDQHQVCTFGELRWLLAFAQRNKVGP